MNPAPALDPQAFKLATRNQWEKAAQGWNDQTPNIRAWLRSRGVSADTRYHDELNSDARIDQSVGFVSRPTSVGRRHEALAQGRRRW